MKNKKLIDVHTADRYGSCEYQIATLEALDGDCHPNEKWVGGEYTTVLMYRYGISASAIFLRGKLEIQVECRCCFISFFSLFSRYNWGEERELGALADYTRNSELVQSSDYTGRRTTTTTTYEIEYESNNSWAAAAAAARLVLTRSEVDI